MSSPVRSLDIVIVNYRSPDMTIDTVRHVHASSLADCAVRLWVVDNGSADGSARKLGELLPGTRIIASRTNLGFAGGNNLALAEILTNDHLQDRSHSYVLLLNSDVQVEPDAIGRCLSFLESHPNAGIVGPKVVLPDGNLDLACRRGFPTISNSFWKLTGFSRRFPENERFAGYNLTHLREDEITEVDAVGGAFMMLRVAAIDDVGLLDERFFMYGEDLDWAYRIKAAGWDVYYFPEARVTHLKSASARRQSWRMIYEFYRAMWLFHSKHYAGSTFFLLNWLVMIGIVIRGILALLTNAFRPTERKRFA